ncbi:MAG TPA: hypothetical protein VEI04_06115 [Syntrophobacteria bacterium]|nr:hypothetical protein [Syntrophobacteria bacterium]
MTKLAILVLTPFVLFTPALAGDSDLAAVVQALDGACHLLAESGVDPCAICSKETRNKAFQILNRQLLPGRIFKTSPDCLLIRSTSGENELAPVCYPAGAPVKTREGEGQLPRVAFRFHTSAKHLVGIAEKDFTGEQVAADHLSAPSGTLFSGVLEIVVYKYGDGPTYNYYPTSNELQVHCKLLDLKPQ